MSTRDIDSLAAEASQYCAAFFYGSFRGLIEQGSAASIGGQGTMTFLTMEGRYFGATNKHVIADAPDTVGDRVFHLAFATHTPFPYRPVAMTDFDNPDAPYDLVLYEIPGELVESNGKKFIDVASAVEAEEGEILLAIGFPGVERYIAGPQMSHPNYIAVAPCESASDRKLIIRYAIPEDERKYIFGGMSGGPLFTVRGNALLPVGILFQGSGPRERQDDDLELWVWGFPVNDVVIKQALRSGAA